MQSKADGYVSVCYKCKGNLKNIDNYGNDYSKDLTEILPHNFKIPNQNCNSSVS